MGLETGGLDSRDGADVVIVGGVAADSDRAEQGTTAPESARHRGTGISAPCAIVLTALTK